MPDSDNEQTANPDIVCDFQLLTGWELNFYIKNCWFFLLLTFSADLCSESVKDLKLEANFRRSLVVTEKTLSDAFKSLPKRFFNKFNFFQNFSISELTIQAVQVLFLFFLLLKILYGYLLITWKNLRKLP